MGYTPAITLLVIGAAAFTGFAAFTVVSLREREPRAARVSALLAVLTPIPFLVTAVLPGPVRVGALVSVAVFATGTVVVWFLPVGRSMPGNGRPQRRVDERDIVFARERLTPGSAAYDAYYARHPGRRAGDERTRALPGLLSSTATKADPAAFASARASFRVTEALGDEVDGPVSPARLERPPAEAAATVKALAASSGALDVGITAVRDYHVYSHVGRGSGRYGEPITLDHEWAVAFTVEMDHAVMQQAPEAPVVAESARQYVAAANIAVPLAAAIRDMGYPARAHIDGNYRVVAPLVALDAGLGEIGRMGILMTPRLGPRVRLGVVTTSLPLLPDSPGDAPSVLDFCAYCRKCAENCPSNSIPFGDREEIDGSRRWRIDADSCFRYWNLIGTDCGRCMAVCPFSHPDNPAHHLVRWGIRHSGAARRAALWMDDLCYGRRPRPVQK